MKLEVLRLLNVFLKLVCSVLQLKSNHQ